MSAVRVDLMASAAGKIGAVAWHHLFIVAAEASGGQSYLRAGPQCLPIERLAGRKTRLGDALEDYEASPAGPYGVMTLSSGSYEPGAPDFDPAAASVTLASANAAAGLWEKLQQAAQALGAEGVAYDPTGKGANWAITELLRRCGLEPQLPPKRWAPGAGALPVEASERGVGTRRLGQAVAVA